jgi:hypothetical protein
MSNGQWAKGLGNKQQAKRIGRKFSPLGNAKQKTNLHNSMGKAGQGGVQGSSM